MIQAVLNTLFHWLFTAPLLYRPVDWIMCVCELYIVKSCVDNIRGGQNAKRKTNKSR